MLRPTTRVTLRFMRREKPGNVLAALVFTDIVGSTQVAEELGDRRWRELLARHHRIVREGLREYGGREVDTAGDGVFARFDSPASAIRFAAETADTLRDLGVEIRAGVHIGECEVSDGKLSGVNVHAAARTMGHAGRAEILVTGSVRELVRGGGFSFADRGAHELRGIEGEWQLFELTSIDDTPRSPPLPEDEARARRGQIVPPQLVKRRRVRMTAVAGAIVAVLAALAFALVHAVGGATAAPVSGCELTNNPPVRDGGLNQSVFNGLTDAATQWGVAVHTAAPRSGGQWHRQMTDLMAEHCGLIVTVGTFAGGATAAEARAHSQQNFATTDDDTVRSSSNLMTIVFKPEQAAFLAGYLAAGMTKTGKVGTFGAIPIPPVTAYMDGFAAGVFYYNSIHGAHVRVLGWNPKTHGLFVDPTNAGDFAAFGDTTTPTRYTSDLISKGADIIFPVDGPHGENSACSAVQRARKVLLIGVDTDQHYSTPDCVAYWLTSVMKDFQAMVHLAMGRVVHHEFSGGVLTGTLRNQGVHLAQYYRLKSRIPGHLLSDLARVKKQVANRSLSVDPKSYPGG